VVAAIQASKGMVYNAARILRCTPQTVRNYAKRYKSVQQAIDNERGLFLDKCEMALADAVKDREPWAVCFALKTLGKQRGYVERHEVTGKDGEALTVVIKRREDT